MIEKVILKITDGAASTPVLLLVTGMCIGWISGLIGGHGVLEPSGLDGIMSFWLGFAILRSTRNQELITRTQMKELIQAIPGARNEIGDIDKMSSEEIEKLREPD